MAYLLTLSSWQRVAHAVLGSRVLLNLRKANDDRLNGTEKQNMSSIAFRRPKARGAAIATRSVVERFGDEVEDWLAPDPQLYPSMVSVRARDEIGTELGTVEEVHSQPGPPAGSEHSSSAPDLTMPP